MLTSASAASSPLSPNCSCNKTLADFSSLFLFTTVNRMDLDRLGHGSPRRQRVGSFRSTSSPQTLEFDYRAVPQPHSSPLPQTEWCQPRERQPRQPQSRERQPREYRPGHEQRPGAYRSTSAQHAPRTWNQGGNRSTQTPPVSRSQRYRRRFRDLLLGPDDGPPNQRAPRDPAKLYPQLGPYDERFSVYSAPDEMEFHGIRSRSPDSSLGYTFLSGPDNPLPISHPRSPTYPPTVRHPTSYATALDDTALADAEDFHLFVEATAGLGVQNAFTRSATDLSGQRHRIPRRPLPTLTTEPVEVVSPVDDASMTVVAMRQLAQMPLGPRPSLPNLRFQSPAAPDISPVDEFEDFDDELPDYAESQAQAQAHLREEAARRAQELQRRWHQGGRQRGV